MDGWMDGRVRGLFSFLFFFSTREQELFSCERRYVRLEIAAGRGLTSNTQKMMLGDDETPRP